jgi:hypothetical protein
MTSPEDDGLEEALRRALSEAASEVKPGTDGLDKIRTRIAGRPPRPWLLSVLFGAADRVRNWTWRGHWARPGWLTRLAEVRWPRLRQGSFPRWGGWSFRLAAVFAAVAVIASVTLGVRPFRNAILQASTGGGGSGSQRITAGTEGNATRTAEGGTGTSSASPAPGGKGSTGSAPSTSRSSNAAKPHSSATKCQPSAQPVATSTEPTLTDQPSGSAIASATGTPSPVVTTRASAQPVYTNTPALTCPVTVPTQSPTPAPSASAPTPTSTATPAGSDPTSGYPTPTMDPTPPTDPTPPGDRQPSPSGPPPWPWPYRHPRHPRYPHFHSR